MKTSFVVLLCGALLGWLVATDLIRTAEAQGQKAAPSATKGTSKTLPRPDFKFPGKVGKTY